MRMLAQRRSPSKQVVVVVVVGVAGAVQSSQMGVAGAAQSMRRSRAQTHKGKQLAGAVARHFQSLLWYQATEMLQRSVVEQVVVAAAELLCLPGTRVVVEQSKRRVEAVVQAAAGVGTAVSGTLKTSTK